MFSEKMTVFANYSLIFHPIMLKFYRHVQSDLAQKRKFSKTGFGVNKFSFKIFSVKITVFLKILFHFASDHAQILRVCAE